MPFAVIALLLGSASLATYGVASNAAAAQAVRGITVEQLEVLVVGALGCVALFILLVPGALVRLLYGRRGPVHPGALPLTMEERQMAAFDEREARQLARELRDDGV